MAANPNYWGWEGEEPPYDQIVFRLFENPDAMVAALQRRSWTRSRDSLLARRTLEADPDIEVVAGLQGGFDQIAINGGQPKVSPIPPCSTSRCAVQSAMASTRGGD